MNIQLSKNFRLSEFTSQDHHNLSLVQIHMLQHLTEQLEIIRSIVNSRLKITSGMRTLEDRARLIRKGYFPSETSDHYFGVPVQLKVPSSKFQNYYTFSVGAADFQCIDCSTEEAYLKIYKRRDEIKSGQLLLEKGNSFWIHLSNPPSLVYSESLSSTLLWKSPYLVSLDRGKVWVNAEQYILSKGSIK